MSREGWKALYRARLQDGYYDRLQAKEEAIANHPLIKLDLYRNFYDRLSETYPWAE